MTAYQAGRGRLDSSANLKISKPPRSLILSTGEETPRGHSVRARLWIIELSPGSINKDLLAKCQSDADHGLYARSMGALKTALLAPETDDPVNKRDLSTRENGEYGARKSIFQRIARFRPLHARRLPRER